MNNINKFLQKFRTYLIERKGLNVLSTVFLGILSMVLISSGLFKIFGGEYADKFYSEINLNHYRVRIGILEIIGTILLWFNKTSKYGMILIWTLMIGATTIHMTFLKDNVYTPLSFGFCIWLIYSIRKHGKDIKSWF